MNRTSLVLIAAILTSALAYGATPQQSTLVAPGTFVPGAVGEMNYPAPSLAIEKSTLAPAATLSRVEQGAREEYQALVEWNRAGRVPARNGIIRKLATPIVLTNAAMKSGAPAVLVSRDATAWTMSTSVRVDQAFRLRLHLVDIQLPPGTVLWVWGSGEKPVAFDPRLQSPNGDIWTPSVPGEYVFLEIRCPATVQQAVSVTVSEVASIIDDPTIEPASTSCLRDASCYDSSTLPVIDYYRLAVAHLEFIQDNAGYVCTGGLINDTDNSTIIPYLLTANHCISTAAAASTLEAFWDYRTASCNGSWPSLGSLQRTSGSSLVATSTNSDFTLLRLNSTPSGRYYLGWDANWSSVAVGTPLYRISHPFPDTSSVPYPQSFSRYTVKTPSECTGVPGSSYIYSTFIVGGTFGGSSGSPVITGTGHIVGQLRGACGPNPADGCDYQNQEVDGAFAATYPYVSSWLNPTTSSCTPDTYTACMLNNRFKVQVRYRHGFDNGAPDTDAFRKPVTGFANPNYETAFFYFNSENNIEMMVKMLDQGNTNSQGQRTIAVLFGTATPLGIQLTITDTTNGAVKTYTSAFNSQKGSTDFTAFVK